MILLVLGESAKKICRRLPVIAHTLYGEKFWATYMLHLQEVLSHGNPPIKLLAQFVARC